ncbi:hypothetical protein K438DRAFT_1984948 [Mycena galopus ATCC 62051]|nr:hypothetical protein K438DRAFT_1984948 [Mycena galopus ATCC 62051]
MSLLWCYPAPRRARIPPSAPALCPYFFYDVVVRVTRPPLSPAPPSLTSLKMSRAPPATLVLTRPASRPPTTLGPALGPAFRISRPHATALVLLVLRSLLSSFSTRLQGLSSPPIAFYSGLGRAGYSGHLVLHWRPALMLALALCPAHIVRITG